MELSLRLQAVADFVSPGKVVADIGTDHAYIPIYLVERGITRNVIAADVNKGPLKRAEDNIVGHGLGDYISTRLSDGLKAFMPGEVESIVIAGMGGALTIRILEEGLEVVSQAEELILQPQSELAAVRKYLLEKNYTVVAENMVLDDGKFYPMMKVKKGQDADYTEEELQYGRILLSDKHHVLKQYLEKELEIKEKIVEGLAGNESVSASERMFELKKEIENTAQILSNF